ncbi:MAG: diguanylate cyclase [Gammaproteobacteria bacterium]|nr:diguanylate cyclase [Gammaproteobacteria bacterium]
MKFLEQLFTSKPDDRVQGLKILIVSFICSFGLVIHMLLLFIFAHIGATTLVYANVVSILVWGVALVIGLRGGFPTAIGIICLEVVFHSAVAVRELGLAAGFQHYLWAMAVLALLNTNVSLWKALAFSAVFVLDFALLYLLYPDVSYQYAFAGAIPVVHTVNVLIAGVPLLLSGVVYRAMHDNQVLHLSELASRDAMTGIYNRRFSMETAERLHMRPDRQELSLVLIDIDKFKQINDSFGHPQGDEVIRHVVQLIRAMVRKSDLVSRWGGEEFLVILPGATLDSARSVAEAIRRAVEDQVCLPDEARSPVTVSLGVVNWRPEQSFQEAFQLVDEALYRSKSNGRNQVTHHETEQDVGEFRAAS